MLSEEATYQFKITSKSGLQQEGDAYWQQHIEAQQKSGLTLRAYCDQQGLTYHRFSYWRHKFLDEQKRQDNPTNEFVSVKIKPTLMQNEALATLELEDKRLIIHSTVGLQVLLSYLG